MDCVKLFWFVSSCCRCVGTFWWGMTGMGESILGVAVGTGAGRLDLRINQWNITLKYHFEFLRHLPQNEKKKTWQTLINHDYNYDTCGHFQSSHVVKCWESMFPQPTDVFTFVCHRLRTILTFLQYVSHHVERLWPDSHTWRWWCTVVTGDNICKRETTGYIWRGTTAWQQF